MPDLTLAGTQLWRGGKVIERSGGDRRNTGFKEAERVKGQAYTFYLMTRTRWPVNSQKFVSADEGQVSHLTLAGDVTACESGQ